MRLWTLHPSYLDTAGLLALWREALLAQRVLAGGTRGYRHHPQLLRFRDCGCPAAAIGAYLAAVHAEATARGYRFDGGLILEPGGAVRIEETAGQLLFERAHLEEKLARRAPAALSRLRRSGPMPQSHPLFVIVDGDVRPWEKRRT